MTRRNMLAAVAGTALLLVGGGCGSLNPYKIAEKGIADYLKDSLGPAKYRVHVKREDTRLSSGYISHLTVQATDLRTQGGLAIKNLNADLYGVRFDRKKKVVTGVERSAFTAAVSEEAANAYLKANDRGIPELSVEFEPGGIIVRAVPRVLNLGVPITLRGRGQAQGGNEINFLTDALAVSRLNLPVAAVRLVENRINPVFDLDDLKLPATLSGVESGQDEILLTGEVKLPGT